MATTNSNEKPRKFSRKYDNHDGTIEEWFYDLDITDKGPVEVVVSYEKGWKSPSDTMQSTNKKLPKNKQTFINPATGKLVKYFRAKQLGLVK